MTPSARPILMMNTASSAACLPNFGWPNRFWHLVERGQAAATAAAPRRLAISRVTFLSGHRSRGRLLQPGGPVHHLGAEHLQRLGGVRDRLVIDAGHEPVSDLLERVEVAGALQFVDPHLHGRVERGGADQDADAAVLPWPGIEPMSQLCSIMRPSTRRPRGSVPNGSGANTSPPPVRSQRPRRGLGLGDVGPADPQLQAPGVLGGDRLRPHRAERAPQPGGELLAALDHLRGGRRRRAGRPRRASRGRPRGPGTEAAGTCPRRSPC